MGLKDAYLKKQEAELRLWDAELQKLEAQAAKAKAEIQLQYYRELNALRIQRQTIQEKMSELERHSGEAWESLKDGVESAWKNLKSALTTALAKFE